MFKDVYKAANDDIKPDPYLMTRILNKASEKRPSIFFRYRFALYAAAIALIVAIPNFVHMSPADSTANIPIAGKEITPVLSAKQSVKETEDYSYTTGNATIYNDTSDKLIYPADSKVESLETTIVMSVNEISPELSTASVMRAGGADESVNEEMSAGDYFDYLGFSPDSLNIPTSLTPDYSADSLVTILKTGEDITSDSNTFCYNGDLFLTVTTSKNTEEAECYLGSEQYKKSVFGDKNAVVLHDGSLYQAHIIHSSGTALKIVTNLPEDDVKNLLISAAK